MYRKKMFKRLTVTESAAGSLGASKNLMNSQANIFTSFYGSAGSVSSYKSYILGGDPSGMRYSSNQNQYGSALVNKAHTKQ